MSVPGSISDYLRQFGVEFGDRILQMYPALYKPGDPVSPRMRTLLRTPYPAQEVAAMSVVRRWQQARAAAVIAECETGKTLVALVAVHCHSDGRPYTALALVPWHLTAKMACEAFLTLPGVRVFFIEALRDRPRDGSPCSVNGVKLRHGKIVRDGLHTTLTDLRLRKNYRTARERWHKEMCAGPALMIVGRDRSKLGWFWRHAHTTARSGPFLGSTVNPDTRRPVYVGENRLVASDFGKARISEIVSVTGEEGAPDAKPRRLLFCTAHFGRRTETRSGELLRWGSSAGTSPRHSAPPRYVSEKSVRDAIDSALTGTFDGRERRLPPPSSSPGTEPSVSNSSIRAALPERTPLRAATLLFESETGPDENRLSQAVRSESSNTRNSRSDRSATGMIDVDYAMRP